MRNYCEPFGVATKRIFVWLLIPFFFALSLNTHAQTIVSIGISNQAGGPGFNKELALARANEFLAEQASVATFRYSRQDGKTIFERLLKSELQNIKVTKSETYGTNGAVVWLSADVDVPQYPDERCTRATETISNAEQTNRIVLRILEKTIPDLLQGALKKTRTITGLSYLRDLSIERKWGRRFTLKTEVCVARITDRG